MLASVWRALSERSLCYATLRYVTRRDAMHGSTSFPRRAVVFLVRWLTFILRKVFRARPPP